MGDAERAWEALHPGDLSLKAFCSFSFAAGVRVAALQPPSAGAGSRPAPEFLHAGAGEGAAPQLRVPEVSLRRTGYGITKREPAGKGSDPVTFGCLPV